MLKENRAVLFQGDKVLLYRGALPDAAEAANLPLTESGSYGTMGPAGSVWGRVDAGFQLPDGWSAEDRRAFGDEAGMEEFKFMTAGWGFADWYHQAQFCGVCGTKMIPAPGEQHAMKCPRCGHMLFPVICPAMIVAVEREGKLLLARNINRPKRLSVLAGFLEVGESIEDAIVREVREEVNIEVDRDSIHYLHSQYWPFPRSLMLACSAQWKSGELRPDGTEIVEANWYGPDEMPDDIPGTITVAGQLVREFLKKYGRTV